MPRSVNELEAIAASRSLQRKLTFWRRMAWSLAGVAAICAAVLWSRSANHRHNCAAALEDYAQLAQDAHLEREAEQILREQWKNLHRQGGGKLRPFLPSHYSLIVENWGQIPQAGESLPLAVCSSPHLVLFSYGRHVLYRDADGFHVKWVAEETAAPIVANAYAEQTAP